MRCHLTNAGYLGHVSKAQLEEWLAHTHIYISISDISCLGFTDIRYTPYLVPYKNSGCRDGHHDADQRDEPGPVELRGQRWPVDSPVVGKQVGSIRILARNRFFNQI